MLKTNKFFRFLDQDSGRCVMTMCTGIIYQVPKEYVFDATCEQLSRTAILSNLDSVKQLYKERLRQQWLLWLVTICGGLFTAAAVVYAGLFWAIPYIIVVGYFGDYILCVPDGRICDPSKSILHISGRFVLSKLPDTFVYIKGSDKYR